ncbi:hypothetical protein A4A49_07426 [Nicotiana attenuata]|uniref:Uncharacterized protein n=1 Tax=Nicotiana attenuata TaxID=49451 RepID=A0A1J6I5Z8_NICAT|nr:hypothetical protein A4A49_07426 [Nicotiana attenuata]
MPDYALLPTDEPRSTDYVPCLHTMATNRANSTIITTKPFVTTGTTEHGDQPNPTLPQGVQLRPREHTGKIRSPKDKSLAHAKDSGDRVQRVVQRNAYCSAVIIEPLVGLVKTNHVGKRTRIKRKALSQNLLPMNFIIWNARGSNSAEFHRHCASMVKLHNHTLLVLLETRMTDHKHLTIELKFSAQFQTSDVGQYGGIVVMWKDDLVKLEEVSTTPQGVHVMVKVTLYNSKWLCSTIYASNYLNDMNRLWDY